jgi:multiple sugar transport system permease protein/putative aldouronate transport system permease protein
MVENKTIAAKIGNALIVALMAVLAISCLFPLWYTFCLSISSKSAVDAGWVTIYPIGFSTFNYREIIADEAFLNSLWISAKRVFIGTPISLLVIILVAYPLSKTAKEFKARKVIVWMLLFCMLFAAGLIPGMCLWSNTR